MSGVHAIRRRIAAGGVGIAIAVASVLGAGSIANAAEPQVEAEPGSAAELKGAVPQSAVPDGAVPEGATDWNSAPADSNGLQSLATKYVGGGKWHYGTTGPLGGGVVYSNYYHASKRHGSTVVSAKGYAVRSATAARGKWSHASTRAFMFGKDRSYWWHA